MRFWKSALCAAAMTAAPSAHAATYYALDFYTLGFGTITPIFGSTAAGTAGTTGLNNLVITTRVESDYLFSMLGDGSYFRPGPFTDYYSTTGGVRFVDRSLRGRVGDDVVSANACFANTPAATLATGYIMSAPGCGSARIAYNDNFAFLTEYSGTVTALRISLVDGPVTTLTTTFAGTVPEPSSWALMLAGFGMAACALRRRQRVAFA